MSKYMQAKFRKEFFEVMEMWIGEDGMLMSLAITRQHGSTDKLKEHWVFHKEGFDANRIKERFVYRGRDYDEDFGGSRVLWRVGDTETDYPIYEYELQVPR